MYLYKWKKANADVFPVIANTRTKSIIQKQIKSKYPEEYSTLIE